ncbi:unnamed protein product [Bursaphelenchus xylophilus]|uniref:Cytochrome b5 n=1 Tax=Bursaphelenchus xylophilus TaxID=6326 RepID=A0A1I7RNH4_BURXY|nr:unnamed protein product [Bursaphelenchus xylophilus]CAG9124018.1 unnamed protein product [Bursaphelenchus xylophilus]
MVQIELPDLQTLKGYSEQDVADMASPDRVLVIIYDLVYDLTEFVDIHPGGAEIIYEMNGLDATSVFEDVGHSKLARTILLRYVIGRVLRDDLKLQQYQNTKAMQNIRF